MPTPASWATRRFARRCARKLAGPGTSDSSTASGTRCMSSNRRGRWSRELGVLSLAEAARRLTGHPARIYGIRERGVLQPGYHADLLLFDPKTVNRGPN